MPISVVLAAQSEPVELVGKKQGTRCNKRISEEISYRNISSEIIKLRLCVKKVLDGKWSCTSNSGLKPGKSLSHFSCSGIADYRYWWGEAGAAAIYPSYDKPSGHFWTSTANCSDNKIHFWIENPHPAFMKVHLSTGGFVGYKKKKINQKNGKSYYVADYEYLYGLICETKKNEGSWLNRMKGLIRKSYIKDCIESGKSRKACLKSMKNKKGVGSVRG